MNQTVNQLRLNSVKNINSLSKGNNLFRPFDKLSYKEQEAFINAHENKLLPYLNTANENTAIRNLYNNLAFVKRFGRDAFNKLSNGTENGANIRLSMLNKYNDTERNNALLKRSGIINESFKSVFGKDQNFNEMEAGLDDQAKLSLLSNTKYLTDAQLKFQFNKDKKEIGNLNKQKSNYYSPISNPFSAVADMTNVTKPFDNAKQRQENNKNILDSLYSQVQKRREGAQDIKQLTNQYYQNLLKNDSNNKQSLATSLNNFDVLASKASGYYAQFKHKSELADYSDTDKLKDYAKFMALSSKYGTGVALSYLDHSMQDRVAKAQDWKFTGNTLKRIFTTAWSDFGGKVAMMYNASTGNLFDAEKMGLINQGLVPVYDKDGKIIGQKENTNIWTNPAYWNDVYMYNVYTPEAIRLIKERHGVSPDLNVREYGYNPNEHFISWDTLYEGISQTGHILDSVVETALLGGIGKIAGSAAGAALKGLGMGAKTLGRVSKGAKLVNNAIMDVVASTNGPQGEAMGTFNEQLENNKEAINGQIKKELHDYYNNIDYSTNEAKSSIGAIYRQLKQKDLSRLRRNAIEGGTRQLPMSDSTLMQQARQLYTNALLKKEEDRLRVKHEKDLKEAATNAARTYMTNWVMDFGKELILTHGIQQFKIAKGAKYGNLDENSISSHLIADAKTGGVKRALNNAANEIKNTGAKKLAKGIAKQVAGGFMDEYLDGINANFSEGAGTNAFKSYMNRTYNPHDYATTIQGVYGDLLAGVDEGLRGITNRENLYEGFIGGISPFVTVTPNIGNIAYHPRDTWNAMMHGEVKVGKDSNGEDIIKPINIFERAGNVITNPILDEYIKGKEKERVKDVAIDNGIETINKVVKQYKENGTIDDAAKAMAAARGYSSKSNADDNSESSFVMNAEDKKLGDAFALMSVAQALEHIDGGKQSSLYQKTMERMKGLADGTLSDKEKQEEINQFLSSPDNKSIMDNNPPEVAKLIAEERLQKNAQFFLDMYKKKQEIEDKLLSTPSFNNMDSRTVNALEYQLLAKDNWKERLRDLEDQLGVGVTNTEVDYSPNLEMIYGAGTARKAALNARIKDSERASEERLKINQDNAASNKKIEALEEQLVNSDTEDEKKEVQTKIDQEKNLIKTRDLRSKQLQVKQESLSKEVETLRQLVTESTDKSLLDHSVEFTVDGILNSDARTRAEILNPANRQRYTKKQQAIIERATNKLAEKDADALQKILDAGELAHRVEDSSTIYNTLLTNPDVAVAYFDAKAELRDRQAFEESLQREILQHYKSIDDALANPSHTPEQLRDAVMQCSSRLIAAYMQDHPNSVSELQSYHDLIKFDEDAAALIVNSKESEEAQHIRLGSLLTLQQDCSTREELIKKIEELIDSDSVDEDNRRYFDDLLNKMKTLGYQRDATVVENRENKRKREAEQKAKREEKEREEQRKQEEEKKAQEESSKTKEEEAKEKAPKEENNNKKASTEVNNDETSDETPVDTEDDTEPTDIIDYDDDTEEGSNFSWDAEPEGDVEDVDLGELLNTNSEEKDKKSEKSKKDSKQSQQENSDSAGNSNFAGDQGVKKEVNTVKVEYNSASGLRSIDAEPIEFKDLNPGDKFIDETKIINTFVRWDNGTEGIVESGDSGTLFMINPNTSEGKSWLKHNTTIYRIVDNTDKSKSAKEPSNETTSKEEDNRVSNKESSASNHSEKPQLQGNITKDSQGNISVDSPSLKEEIEEINKDDKKVSEPSFSGDSQFLNNEEESNEKVMSFNNNPLQATVSGNAMSEWKTGEKGDYKLDMEGKLEHKQGEQENDHMNKFFAWTKAQGWHIQNIIDQELGRILLRNPKAKVKFMSTNNINNATHDNDVFNDMFLVLDYDDKVNRGITSIHNEDNGGVVTANGKKYLVIGTSGYAKNDYAAQKLRNFLWSMANNEEVRKRKKEVFGNDDSRAKDGYGMCALERVQYFKDHPTERFFVSEKYSTQVVPGSLIPGFRVKQLDTDDEINPKRNILDMLNDPIRNPQGITEEDLYWLIQTESATITTSRKSLDIMNPQNKDVNSGSVFVLFRGANGKYFCGHVNPIRYTELKEGAIQEETQRLLNQLCSFDVNARVQAIVGLSKLYVFKTKNSENSKAGDCILTHRTKEGINLVSFLRDGIQIGSFYLNEAFDRSLLFNAFKTMNPRVNVSLSKLKNKTDLQRLNEAGALTTDLAQLALAGASYRIYGVDVDGSIVKPKSDDIPLPDNDVKMASTRLKERLIPYTDDNSTTNYYTYNQLTGKYSLNGNDLIEGKDDNLIKQLEYNRNLDNYKFVKLQRENTFYIVNEDNPLCIKVNNSTHHVTELSTEESLKYIEEYNKAIEDAERQRAAEEVLNSKQQKEKPQEEDTQDKAPLKESSESETSKKESHEEEASKTTQEKTITDVMPSDNTDIAEEGSNRGTDETSNKEHKMEYVEYFDEGSLDMSMYEDENQSDTEETEAVLREQQDDANPKVTKAILSEEEKKQRLNDLRILLLGVIHGTDKEKILKEIEELEKDLESGYEKVSLESFGVETEEEKELRKKKEAAQRKLEEKQKRKEERNRPKTFEEIMRSKNANILRSILKSKGITGDMQQMKEAIRAKGMEVDAIINIEQWLKTLKNCR